MDGVKWKVSGLFKGDARTVYDEIQSIANGKDTKDVGPHEIVEYAERNTDSELYKCFDWDDKSAANKWRVKQARDITINLVVTVRDKEDEEKTLVEARVIQRSPETGKYRPVVLMNADEYAKVLKRAWDEARAWKERYKGLKDAGIQAIIDLID